MSPALWTFIAVLAIAGCAQAIKAPSFSGDALSLTAPFSNANWRSFGSALFSPNQAILTSSSGKQAQRGALWNQSPMTMSPTWEVIFRFKVAGPKAEGSAEGMALWLTTTKDELGNAYGSRDYFNGIAIVFDSYDNDKRRNNPAISAHYLDGRTPYSLQDDGLSTQIAGCIADYRNRENVVSAKVAYNTTHLSVFVDLTGTNEYRKCLIEPLDLQLANVYLGVSAETTNAPTQETHEVKEIVVKGAFDSTWQQNQAASGYKPPAQAFMTPPVAQMQYQAPPVGQQQYQAPPVGQQQYQAPPAAQQQYQAPPVAAAVPFSDDETVAVHEKLDHLLKAAASSLDSQSAGEALKEIEQNLRSHMSGATKAVLARIARLETLHASGGNRDSIAALAIQLEELNKLMTANKASVDAGRIETERRFNEADTKFTALAKDLASIRELVERSSRSTLNLISRSTRDSKMNMSGGSSMGWWLYAAMFQTLFVVFLLFKHMSGTKRYDKLI